ncbi:MAG: DUF3035 domain-containing protein [Alphaproteobacteria bacterium]|nr:DUF3035 domain-containing protein [Alphaproteobacteria bacterium]
MTTVLRKLAPATGRALVVVAAASLVACTGFKESIGAAKQAPDETAITTRAPLVVPATFDLKPPTPGAPRAQDADTAAQAQRVLGGPSIKMAPASQGEQALLTASGATSADPKVRQELRNEVLKSSKRKSYADTVLFWRGKRGEKGTPLDPNAEAERMNTAAPTVATAPAPVVIEKAPEPAAPTPADKKEEKKSNEDSSGGWFDWF